MSLCAYTSIGAAIAASSPGDLVYVWPDSYVEATTEINHRLFLVYRDARPTRLLVSSLVENSL
jgi:hypothetical protein